jgi:hypothetical protein
MKNVGEFMTDNDKWSVEQLKEHVAYCYDYVSHGVDLDSHNDISPEHFEILKVLSNPDMFDHGASSKLLGCLNTDPKKLKRFT